MIAQGPKAERLRRLAERTTLSVGADSVVGLDALAAAVAAGWALRRRPSGSRSTLGGRGRACGRRRSRRSCATRSAWGCGSPGVFTHGGHGYAGRAERLAAADDEVTGLGRAADGARAAGVEEPVVSAGSTPTAVLSAHGAITEERPGTYIFGDRQQAYLAGQELDDTALLVASTVVSAGPGTGFIIDAGAKILAKDPSAFSPGHGSIVGYPDAVIVRVNDHHGIVELPEGGVEPRPPVGTIVWVAPNHVCPVVNLVDEYVVAQGGQIVDRWPVDGRGRNG